MDGDEAYKTLENIQNKPRLPKNTTEYYERKVFEVDCLIDFNYVSNSLGLFYSMKWGN